MAAPFLRSHPAGRIEVFLPFQSKQSYNVADAGIDLYTEFYELTDALTAANVPYAFCNKWDWTHEGPTDLIRLNTR